MTQEQKLESVVAEYLRRNERDRKKKILYLAASQVAAKTREIRTFAKKYGLFFYKYTEL